MRAPSDPDLLLPPAAKLPPREGRSASRPGRISVGPAPASPAVQPAIPPEPAPPRAGRDPRIDFFRGLALLTIFSTHLNPSWVKKISPTALGFWDSAELFVFLSGYVAGLVYLRLLERGVLPCLAKAYQQAGKLYLANAGALVVTLGCLGLFFSQPPYGPAGADRFLSAPAQAFTEFTTLAYLPWGFGILSLYIGFLLALPGLLWVVKRWGVGAMVLVSFAAYAAVQLFPATVCLPEPWRRAWYFNPFAWQFLFFLGVALSRLVQRGRGLLPPSRALLALAVAGVAAGALAKVGYAFAFERPFFDTLRLIFLDGAALDLPMLREVPWGTGKPDLEPIRLVNFACLVAAATILIPRQGWFWVSRPAVWVRRCGEQSLFVFCAHAFLVNVFNGVLLADPHNLWLQAGANVAGWALLLLAGNALAKAAKTGQG